MGEVVRHSPRGMVPRAAREQSGAGHMWSSQTGFRRFAGSGI
jgi:hypothetical protein